MPPDCAENVTKNPIQRDQKVCSKAKGDMPVDEELLTGWVLLVEGGGLDGVNFTQRAILPHLFCSTVRIVIWAQVSLTRSRTRHQGQPGCPHTHIVDRKGQGT